MATGGPSAGGVALAASGCWQMGRHWYRVFQFGNTYRLTPSYGYLRQTSRSCMGVTARWRKIYAARALGQRLESGTTW